MIIICNNIHNNIINTAGYTFNLQNTANLFMNNVSSAWVMQTNLFTIRILLFITEMRLWCSYITIIDLEFIVLTRRWFGFMYVPCVTWETVTVHHPWQFVVNWWWTVNRGSTYLISTIISPSTNKSRTSQWWLTQDIMFFFIIFWVVWR